MQNSIASTAMSDQEPHVGKKRESQEQFTGDNSFSWFCLSDGARLDKQLCTSG